MCCGFRSSISRKDYSPLCILSAFANLPCCGAFHVSKRTVDLSALVRFVAGWMCVRWWRLCRTVIFNIARHGATRINYAEAFLRCNESEHRIEDVVCEVVGKAGGPWSLYGDHVSESAERLGVFNDVSCRRQIKLIFEYQNRKAI